MSHNWNLESIYPSFTSETYLEDISRIQQLIEKLNNECEGWLSTSAPKTTLEGILHDFNQVYELLYTVAGFASLNFTVNTKDADAIGAFEKAEQLITELTKPDVKFTRFVGSLSNLEALI